MSGYSFEVHYLVIIVEITHNEAFVTSVTIHYFGLHVVGLDFLSPDS